MKYKTLEERYSREQILKCSLVYHTYEFGCSPVVFINPYGFNEFITDDLYDTVYHYYDLKAAYMLELWNEAKEKTDFKFHGWDDFEWYYNPDDNFKKMIFSNPTKKGNAISFFWKELQETADSGEIFVEEKFYTEGKNKKYWVLNSLGNKLKREYFEGFDNSFWTGPFFSEEIKKTQKRTWKWNEIKDFFVELSDEELELFNVYEMNQCTVKDIPLLEACSKGDFESIKQAIKNGANVNAINKGYGCLEKLVYQYNDQNLNLYKELNDQYYQYIYQNKELAAHYNEYVYFDDPCRYKYIDMYRELEEWYSKESEKIKKIKGKSLLLEYEKIIDYLLDEGLDINLNICGTDLLTLVYSLGNNELLNFLIQKGASVHDNSIFDKIHDIRANFIGTPLLERIENLLCDVPSQISETDIRYLEYVNDLNEKKSILLKAGAKQWIDGWDDSKLEKFYDEFWEKIIYD